MTSEQIEELKSILEDIYGELNYLNYMSNSINKKLTDDNTNTLKIQNQLSIIGHLTSDFDKELNRLKKIIEELEV